MTDTNDIVNGLQRIAIYFEDLVGYSEQVGFAMDAVNLIEQQAVAGGREMNRNLLKRIAELEDALHKIQYETRTDEARRIAQAALEDKE